MAKTAGKSLFKPVEIEAAGPKKKGKAAVIYSAWPDAKSEKLNKSALVRLAIEKLGHNATASEIGQLITAQYPKHQAIASTNWASAVQNIKNPPKAGGKVKKSSVKIDDPVGQLQKLIAADVHIAKIVDAQIELDKYNKANPKAMTLDEVSQIITAAKAERKALKDKQETLDELFGDE